MPALCFPKRNFLGATDSKSNVPSLFHWMKKFYLEKHPNGFHTLFSWAILFLYCAGNKWPYKCHPKIHCKRRAVYQKLSINLDIPRDHGRQHLARGENWLPRMKNTMEPWRHYTTKMPGVGSERNWKQIIPKFRRVGERETVRSIL